MSTDHAELQYRILNYGWAILIYTQGGLDLINANDKEICLDKAFHGMKYDNIIV